MQAVSLGFEGDNYRVFAACFDNKITVYENKCPHLGTTLEFMPNQFLSFDKSLILCATHGAMFEHGTGYCVSGPCSGQRLQVIPHQEIEGWVCIELP